MSATPKITLILGGARSGKSAYAEELAAEMGQSVLYIATATAETSDAEMVERVAQHRLRRPPHWRTLEASRNVDAALSTLPERPDAILLDCLTLLVSNIVLAMEERPPAEVEAAALAEVEAIVAAQQRLGVPLIVVSSEVGLGIAPAYPLGRLYRDILGRVNQRVAAAAGRVVLLVAGLPLVVK
jgi:adenosylcobinamide kinase/adenosylcobinamide-phosphate guanylyltransferase